MGKFYKTKSNKAKNLDKEPDKHQKMFHEVKRLEQEVERLNTIIKRVEKGSCVKCSEAKSMPKKQKPSKAATCPKCSEDSLGRLEYYKGDETWFFERCSGCGHRTVGKKA